MDEKTIFQIKNVDTTQVLEVFELLSEYNNKEILQAAQKRIDEGFTTFVVDLSGIPYVNSVGLNFLITLQSRSNDAGGEIVVANVSSKIMQLLEITKLEPLFQLTDSVDSALQIIETN